MAVRPEDLLAVNGGEIEDSMFTGDVDKRLAGYVAEAQARLAAWKLTNVGHTLTEPEAEDNAVRLFAYYRAFKAFHTILLTNPAKATVRDQGDAQWLPQQISAAASRANDFLMEFQSFLAVYTPVPAYMETTPSTSIRNRFVP